MKSYKVFVIVFFCLCSLASYGQNIKSIKKKADKNFEAGNYYRALHFYETLDAEKPGDAKTLARIGICYLKTRPATKALDYLKAAKEKKYKKDYIDFYLAKAYHAHHDFETAISIMGQCRSMYKDLREEIETEMSHFRNGLELSKNPVKVSIENLGEEINSEFPEYRPVILGDERTMFLTARRPGTTGNLKDEQGQYFEDIYVSYYENDKWQKPIKLSGSVNSSGNDASLAVTPDGKGLLLGRQDLRESSGTNIYYSEYGKGKWQDPKKLSINTSGEENSACLSPDGNTLYFCSDREGGFGGSDIYVSHKQEDGDWGKPKNLGSLINSPYNESSPFLHADGVTLFFSSEGHKSIGGYDIFSTTYDPETGLYSAPENLGYPINTAGDEKFFVWSADGTRGYFSSVREDGFGDYDIYMITRPNVSLSFSFYDGREPDGFKPTSGNLFVYDAITNELITKRDSTSFEGECNIMLKPGRNYAISIEADGFLSHSENVNVPVNDFYVVDKSVFLTPLEKGGLIVLNNVLFEKGSCKLNQQSTHELDRYFELINDNPSLVIEVAGHCFEMESSKENMEVSQKRAKAVVNYLVSKGLNYENLKPVGYGDRFASSDEDLSRTELIIKENLKENPDYKQAGLGAYDGILKGKKQRTGVVNNESKPGQEQHASKKQKMVSYLMKKQPGFYVFFDSAAYKKEVSLRDAIKDSVEAGKLEPVIVKGSVQDREKGVPLAATVQMSDHFGVDLEEMTCGNDGTFSFKAFNKKDVKYSVTARINGYNYLTRSVKVPANRPEVQEIEVELVLTELAKGQVFQLRNIYFDLDTYKLSPESYRELKKLEKLLVENPELKIEISGHTDNVGDKDYNKTLSRRRAQSVADYLINKGIDIKRLRVEGYGEERPIASNDDEIDGREINRRIEFKVIEN
ncbi:OmpA family protein [Cytophagaceae bacterium ABcell3]|nr:OmpA family protein [Cytophagaceae bacterium ABcell3]